MQFKIGDIVTIIGKRGTITWVPVMKRYIGKTYEVSDASLMSGSEQLVRLRDIDTQELIGWSWSNYDLELSSECIAVFTEPSKSDFESLFM